MLTEHDARALLAQAADTIEVGPATPVEPVRRRAWPLLAAAVATVVAGVGVWAGVAAMDTDAAPDPAIDPGLLQPGTVPSVFGHRRAAAVRILTDAGLDVRIVERLACDPPGQAIGTLPSTGVRMEPGSTVTLQVAAFSAVADCFADLTVPGQLLGLATGEVASPDLLTGRLTTYLDGDRRVVADASDPEAWGSPSALDALRAAVEWSPEVPREWRTLESQEPGCDGNAIVPNVIAGTTLQRYVIEYDAPDAPCAQLTVVGDFGQAPTAVAVETAGLEVGNPEPVPDQGSTVPAVFGLTEGEALKALQDAGVGNLVTVAEPGCLEPGRALGTEPGAGAVTDPSDPVRLTVARDYTGANCALIDRAFWSLLDVARGSGPGPRSAGMVRTWLDGAETTATGVEEPAGWDDVPALSALAAVADDPYVQRGGVDVRLERVGRTEPLSFPVQCAVGGEPPPALPDGVTDRPSFQVWFAYQSEGATGACLVVDVFGSEQQRLDALVVRTVDPDGLLPPQPTSPDPEELSDVASTLVDFATYEVSAPPPLAAEVDLYEEGEFRRTASADELTDRNAWQVCRTEPSGVTCDGTALEQVYYGVGTVPFRSSSQVPSEAPPGTVTVLTVGPPRVTSCQPRGVVTLYLDAAVAVVGVDFVPDTSARLCGEEGLVPPD